MSPPGRPPAECAILAGESVQFRSALTPPHGVAAGPASLLLTDCHLAVGLSSRLPSVHGPRASVLWLGRARSAQRPVPNATRFLLAGPSVVPAADAGPRRCG